MKLLIKNGTLVLRDNEIKADLLVEDGKIAKIAEKNITSRKLCGVRGY